MRRRLLALAGVSAVAVAAALIARSGDDPNPRPASAAGPVESSVAPETPADPPDEPRRSDTTLALAAQTPWVGLGGEFSLRLKVGGPRGLDGLDLNVSVFPPVATRSEFAQTVLGNVTAAPITSTGPIPAVTLNPEPGGEVTLRLGVQDPDQPRDPVRLPLTRRDGVHPVRVQLLQAGEPAGRLMTHLVYLPDGHSGAKLGASLVLPLGGPVTPDAGTASTAEVLNAAAQAIEAAGSLPITVAPTPETIASATGGDTDQAEALTASLRRAVANRHVLGSPYVPVSLPALLAAGLDDEAGVQLQRGSAALTGALGVRLDPKTWLAEENLDSASLGFLAERGVERVIATEAGLVPIPDQKLTLTHPFVLGEGRSGRRAVVADPGLANHFTRPGGAVLSAHNLLADLAVLYLDRPGDVRRGLAVVAPRAWRPDRVFLDTLSAGLSGHPIVEAVPLDTLFVSVPPATTPVGRPLVRRPAPPVTSPLAPVASELRVQRRRLTSLGSMIGRDTPTFGQLEHHLLRSESAAIDTPAKRTEELRTVRDGINAELQELEIPDRRSITLTARKADVPLTLRNRSNRPIRVRVTVQSDKLEFPSGTSRLVELSRANTTERFVVEARTSGAFPLRVTLESPDGNLVIGQSRLTVRSTAVSRVSLTLSCGALLFLALWWGRHVLRGRRARRLVPA